MLTVSVFHLLFVVGTLLNLLFVFVPVEGRTKGKSKPLEVTIKLVLVMAIASWLSIVGWALLTGVIFPRVELDLGIVWWSTLSMLFVFGVSLVTGVYQAMRGWKHLNGRLLRYWPRYLVLELLLGTAVTTVALYYLGYILHVGALVLSTAD